MVCQFLFKAIFNPLNVSVGIVLQRLICGFGKFFSKVAREVTAVVVDGAGQVNSGLKGFDRGNALVELECNILPADELVEFVDM